MALKHKSSLQVDISSMMKISFWIHGSSQVFYSFLVHFLFYLGNWIDYWQNLGSFSRNKESQKIFLTKFLVLIFYIFFRHPLFPLLALLFEKCELATQSSECPSTESFNLDIQAFVQHQGREGKPFFTDNHDVNDLVSLNFKVILRKFYFSKSKNEENIKPGNL